MKELNENIINDFGTSMALLLMAIPGCDSKSCTISVCPFLEAKIKGVLVNTVSEPHKKIL